MGALSADADALVHSALVSGDAVEYANVVGRLSNPRMPPAELQTLLHALARQLGACREDVHAELLHAAVRANWTLDAGVAEAYAHLAQELIARSTAFLEPFLSQVVAAFVSVDLADEVSDAAHAMLRSVLFTCPLGARTLCELIHARFPHRRQPAPAHVRYHRHVLRVMSYEPYVLPILLPQLLQQLVAIDAEAPLPSLGSAAGPSAAEDDADDAEDVTVFHMDDMHGAGAGGASGGSLGGSPVGGHSPARLHAGCGAGVPSAAGRPELLPYAPVLDPEAEKLDQLLALLMEFQQRMLSGGAHAAAHGGGTHSKAAEMVVFGLLAGFDGFIVRAPHAQCVQFALFHGACFHREHAHALLGCFARKLGSDAQEPLAVRLLAVGYIASFAASAAYLDGGTVLSAVDTLVQYAHTLAAGLAAAAGPHGGGGMTPGRAQSVALATRRLLLATVHGACLALERRWAQLSAVLAPDAASGEEPSSLLPRLRAAIQADQPNALAALQPSTRAFVLWQVLGLAGGSADAPAEPDGGGLAGEEAWAGAFVAPAQLHLPFEEYVLPESGAFIRPIHMSALRSAPPSHDAAAAIAAAGGGGTGLGGGVGAAGCASMSGSVMSGGGGGGGGGAAGGGGGGAMQRGSLSASIDSPLGSAPTALGARPAHGGAEVPPTTLHVPLAAAVTSSPVRNASPASSLRLGAPLPATEAMALERGARAIPFPSLLLQQPAAQHAGSTQLPRSIPHASVPDSHELADSFNNCSMSFSPDDLETHIRKRFEECKRAAVIDGLGGSPHSPSTTTMPFGY